MDRVEKLELVKRSLGLRHKLKVQDSLKPPETHDDLAVMLLAKWELEDEIRAIEEILASERARSVSRKRAQIEKAPISIRDIVEGADTDEATATSKTPKKRKK